MKSEPQGSTKKTSEVQPERESMTVVLHFDHNSSVLGADARASLEKIISSTARDIDIRAYTDSTGSESYNAWLSAQRADRVKEYVIRQGVAPERIRIEAMGECCFVASNASPEGRASNRRVEVTLNNQ
jgi:outer membrane protein OmpA-like peptidoglycan-associated protein